MGIKHSLNNLPSAVTSLKNITLSIVSHGHGIHIYRLLCDLEVLAQRSGSITVHLTLNIPESLPDIGLFPNLHLVFKVNSTPAGFGENHNTAFAESGTEYFAVVNPDIRIKSLDFLELLQPFSSQYVAAVAPLVLSDRGSIEDSFRRFPTLKRFFSRVLLRQRYPDYMLQQTPFFVDWVAGMFIVFRSEVFENIGGFDDHRFFMYLEDADICRRIQMNGFHVVVNPNVSVIHNAQRASRRNLRHMWWHLKGALRFLTGF